MNLNVRLCSKKAIEEISRKNLLDMYSQARLPVPAEGTTTYNISVRNGKFYAEILGGFNAVQKQLIQSVRGLTDKDMKSIKAHSNGHKFLRYVTNCMSVDNLNEIMTMYNN